MKDNINSIGLGKINKNRIYKYLFSSDGSVTKQELEKNLQLSRPTVAQDINELMEAGYIEYGKSAVSTGGRKAKTLAIKSDAAYAVGLSINYNVLQIAIIDLSINVIDDRKYSLNFSDNDRYYSDVAALLENSLNSNGIDRSKLIGVGVSIPGVIGDDNTTVSFAPTLSDKVISLEGLKKAIDYDVFVINDALASGVAQCWGMENPNNMAFLYIGTGVGGTIWIGGKAYIGDFGKSGEFGHMCLVPHGKRCACGQYGCFEAYASTKCISTDINLSLEEFFSRLEVGDREISGIWNEYLYFLARGIANICAALDCKVILGGLLEPYIAPYMTELQEKVRSFVPFPNKEGDVGLSRFVQNASCVGAAMHFIQGFVENI